MADGVRDVPGRDVPPGGVTSHEPVRVADDYHIRRNVDDDPGRPGEPLQRARSGGDGHFRHHTPRHLLGDAGDRVP